MDSSDGDEPTITTVPSTITRPSEATFKPEAEKSVVISEQTAKDQTTCTSGKICVRRQGKDHKKAFRVPLKKDDGNMESQIIKYNCEFPNRVVLRLEYLMHSTKVRLNDRIYMDDLFTKLIEEENTFLEKSSKSRERAEQNRMKKLIIDGHMPEIPEELSYLKRHPVLRVNRLLARLNEFEHDMGLSVEDDENNQLTPVEPYEYDGNKFFKTLHDEGVIWMPSCQLIHNENKLAGKVYRSKLRLLQKRKEEEAEEKILKLLNADKEENLRVISSVNLERDNLKRLSGPEISVVDAFNLRKSHKSFPGKKEIEKIKRKLRQEVSMIKERIQESKELELQSEAHLDSRRREQENLYMDTFDYDFTSIMTRYHDRQIQRDLDDILKTKEYIKQYQEEIEARDEKRKSNLKKKKASTKRKSWDDKSKLAGQPSFQRLKEAFDIEEEYPFHHFEAYEDPRLEQLDKAETLEEMTKEGNKITKALLGQDHDDDEEDEEEEYEEDEEEQDGDDEEEQEEELELEGEEDYDDQED